MLGSDRAPFGGKFFSGKLEPALEHFGQFRVLEDPATRVAIARRYGLELGIVMRAFEARVLWFSVTPTDA